MASGVAVADPTNDDLPTVVRAAKDGFRQTTAADLDQAKQRLGKVAAKLGRRLDRDGENGKAWKKHLHWDVLQTQMADDAAADLERLASVRERFAGNHAGLERKIFADVRLALGDYIELVQQAANPNSEREYAEQLEALAVALEQRAREAKPEQLERIGALLGWLQQRSQAPSVVEAVRGQYSHPNLQIRVSEPMIASNLRKTIEMTTPVDQEILRTRITGTGHTVGRVRASLVPDESRAVLNLHLDAVTQSETVGRRGPVEINSSGRTQLAGRKQIAFGPEGFTTTPTSSSATTETRTTGIATRFKGFLDRAVRRLATRQVEKKRSQGNRIASRYAEQMINSMMDEQVGEMLDQFNTIYIERIRNPLLRNDDFPRQFVLRGSPGALEITLMQANSFQVAAPEPAPVLAGTPDLGLVLHESAVNNFASAVLGGKTFTEEQICVQLARLRRDPPEVEEPTGPGSMQITVPDQLIEIPLPEEADEGIEFTLVRENPVTLRIDDGVVSVTFRGERYVDGGRTYPPMNITVRYRLEKADSGMRATMEGKPEVVPPRFAQGNAAALTPEEAEIQGKLEEFLDRELRQELASESVTLPEQLDTLGKLPVTELRADDGWLALACRQEVEVEAVAAEQSEPAPTPSPPEVIRRACRMRSILRR